MKILIAVSYIDLHYKIGCTPAFWQLFKRLYERGHELIITPYAGKAVESLWWQNYPNPAYLEFLLYNSYKKISPKRKKKKAIKKDSVLVRMLTKRIVARKWKSHLIRIFEKEGEFDAVLLINMPLNHLPNIGRELDRVTAAPIIYYNGDMPVHLPKYGGFSSGVVALLGADLSQFDLVITNSEGVYDDLIELKAERIETLHWGADPEVFYPHNSKKIFDFFFFGFGKEFRESWIDEMMIKPSLRFPDLKYLLGGWGFEKNHGNCLYERDIPFSVWRKRCAQSKINLNISRESHSSVCRTSTARPFELASLECCIVSNPHRGLDKWFDPKREIFIINEKEEISEIYNFLLSDPELREKTGKLARIRILKEHTYKHRAQQLEQMIRSLM